MATKKYYIGSIGPFLIDDTAAIDDPDGDFAGELLRPFTTNGPLYIDSVPTDPLEVVRLNDLSTIGLQYPLALDSMRSGITRYPAPRTMANPNDLFRYGFMMGS